MPVSAPNKFQVKHLRIDPAGRVVIPSSYRKALNIKPGDELVLRLLADRIELISPAKALNRIQDSLQRNIKPGSGSMVDELLAERREEARGED